MTVQTPIEVEGRSIPPWAIGLTVLVFLVGGVYLAGNLTGQNPPILRASDGPSASGAPNLAQQARQLMDRVQPQCTVCHGADLTGGVGPSLHAVAGGAVSPNLQDLAAEHPDNWANLWIDGTGPEVEGIDRMGMPAFGDQLTADEIATIVEYLKTLQ